MRLLPILVLVGCAGVIVKQLSPNDLPATTVTSATPAEVQACLCPWFSVGTDFLADDCERDDNNEYLLTEVDLEPLPEYEIDGQHPLGQREVRVRVQVMSPATVRLEVETIRTAVVVGTRFTPAHSGRRYEFRDVEPSGALNHRILEELARCIRQPVRVIGNSQAPK